MVDKVVESVSENTDCLPVESSYTIKTGVCSINNLLYSDTTRRYKTSQLMCELVCEDREDCHGYWFDDTDNECTIIKVQNVIESQLKKGFVMKTTF